MDGGTCRNAPNVYPGRTVFHEDVAQAPSSLGRPRISGLDPSGGESTRRSKWNFQNV